MRKQYKVIIEKTETGFSAYSEKYPVYTTGGTVDELARNIVEAFNLFFEEAGGDASITLKDIRMNYSLPSLFELYPINVKHFANRIGMNYTLLSQYVRGRKIPSAKQIEKIVEGLQEVGKELSQVQLI
jgi:predicted RNase H-like HicB family nuclease